MTEFFATCPKDLEYLLVDELNELGVDDARPGLAGVYFSTELILAQKYCLWSRLANRVLMMLANGPVDEADDVYQLALKVPWEQYLKTDSSIAVNASSRHKAFSHDRFLAQRVKDAVCDRLRLLGRDRPDVNIKHPDVPLYAFIDKKGVRMGLDMSGRSLHERGYRKQAGKAPLRENIAAAVLHRAGWPKSFPDGALVDPMCGSGTIVIEAALMATDTAPGLLSNQSFAFENWENFDSEPWQAQLAEARQRRQHAQASLKGRLYGTDIDHAAIKQAMANAQRAGVAAIAQFSQSGIEQFKTPSSLPDVIGLIVTNPPYGIRIDAQQRSTEDLYRILGERARDHFIQWQLSVLVADEKLAHAIPFKPLKKYSLPNGAIPCRLINYQIPAEASSANRSVLSDSAQMLLNRLKKNQRKLKSYLKREQIEVYRLYDADLPEYASAIDVYGSKLHIQEYAAPASIPEALARSRFAETIRVAEQAMSCDAASVYVKTRNRQKGKEQYQKTGLHGTDFWVQESGLKFKVNLTDYLDSGIFADHRQTRQLIRRWAKDGRFLNLFCYTASASVYAASGGAQETLSVDMSKTYLDWALENFQENGLNPYQHRLIQADCLSWLKQTVQDKNLSFDLIFLDPPTFSNSKRMRETFDVLKDHVALINHCMQLLNPDGRLVFSTNARRFKLDASLTEAYQIEETTSKTVPLDYQQKKSHQSWVIQL